jgi:primase-polymerase (primpol)-like protein
MQAQPDLRVPDGLAELDQWVLWRFENVNGRAAKVPYSVRGARASSTNPGTWSPFQTALNALRRQAKSYAGLGFVFVRHGGIVGIDLDDCLDSAGMAKSWARGVVDRFFDSYMEISPSGKGVKIWARGELPAKVPGVKIGDGQIEMYDHARYFAVTGRAFQGAPLQLERHEEDLKALFNRLVNAERKTWLLQPLENGLIPHGQQHSTLVSIAGTLRARRVCDEAIEACLQAINRHQCERPGPPENVSRIVRSSRGWGNQ